MGTGTELGKVRGLGSAKEGTHHWWQQRLTAAANLVLMAWLLMSIAMLPDHGLAAMTAWVHSAWAAIPLMLLTISLFYHARLGLQVLIEDYVHDESRIVLTLLLNAFAIGGAAIALFSIAKIAFTGTPA